MTRAATQSKHSVVDAAAVAGAAPAADNAPHRQRKILFLSASLGAGGAERQMVLLATGLRARGYETAVAVFYERGPWLSELASAGVRVIPLHKNGRRDFLGAARRLRRVIREERPDVLHSYHGTPNLMAISARLLRDRPRIVWGIRSSNTKFRRYGIVSSISFLATRLACRGADLIIANSRAGADYHIRHWYPASRMAVVPNGIDTERFQPDVVGRQRIRAEWGIQDDELLIGLPARLDPVKDHRTFLAAAKALLRRMPTARFVCVGDGDSSYLSALMEHARSLKIDDRVIWAGYRSDMAAIYSAMDVATLCSAFGEGFPNCVAEAMACGTPCVVTNVGDSARIIGDVGGVVSPGDAASLSGGWERVAANRTAALSRSCRERIVEQFSVAKLVATTEQVLAPYFASGA